MAYDDISRYLGDFGRYQRRIYFLLCLPVVVCAFHKLAGVFLLARLDFRCQLPFEGGAANYESLPRHLWNHSYPWNNATQRWDTCEYYVATSTSTSSSTSSSTSVTAPCQGFVYDRSRYRNSVVSDWDLVCERALLAATSDALFMVGVLVGSLAFGQLSDRYGRKPIFFLALVLQLVFGVGAAIAPNYYAYTASRFVIGGATSGVILIAYVLGMELVGPTHRLFAGVICQMFFSFGFMLTAAFAYYIHDWRTLQIALTVPGLLFLGYYCLVPESARWLLLKKRNDEAAAVIRKAAHTNGVTIPPEVFEHLLDDTNIVTTTTTTTSGNKESTSSTAPREASIFDLLKYPNLRRKTFVIFFDWFVNSGTYYALSWNTSNLGGNDLLNFVVSGAVEIPAYIFLLATLNRWGRRTILCGCMLCAGLALMLTTTVPPHMHWALVTLAMIGKLAITASYGTIYIFTAEQFPTVVRNVGLGASSMVARIGGILAPYLNLLATIWTPLPLLTCGTVALIGGVLSLMLPETYNRPMLETIEDGENFGKTKGKGKQQQQNICTVIETDVEVLKTMLEEEEEEEEEQDEEEQISRSNRG